VRIVRFLSNGQPYEAVAKYYGGKFINEETISLIKNEYWNLQYIQNSLMQLNEENKRNGIQRIQPWFATAWNMGSEYLISKFQPKKIIYIILERMSHGDLYSFINKLHMVPNLAYIQKEMHARYIFKKLLDAIEKTHKCGYYHGDIKPENAMFARYFEQGALRLNLIDFAYSMPCIGTGRTGKINIYRGTANYASPEIRENKPFNGFQADVFAASCALFWMMLEIYPFRHAIRSDPDYTLIIECKYADYWDNMEKKLSSIKANDYKIDPDLKDLLEGTLKNSPEDRLTLSEIKAHPWLKRATFTDEQAPMEILKIMQMK